MAKKKKSDEKGHNFERHGYRISTSPIPEGWLVSITPRGKSDSGVSPRPSIEKDGFRFEGEAIDWAEDWAQENRPYTVKIETTDAGFYGRVFDEVGFEQYSTTGCGEVEEARKVAESWVSARRRHDLQVIDARRAARANYRMVLEDLQVQQDEEEAAIEAAKGRLKSIDKDRDEAKRNLHDPQIPFNFVAELERRGSLQQTDIEDRLRGATGRSRRTAAGKLMDELLDEFGKPKKPPSKPGDGASDPPEVRP